MKNMHWANKLVLVILMMCFCSACLLAGYAKFKDRRSNRQLQLARANLNDVLLEFSPPSEFSFVLAYPYDLNFSANGNTCSYAQENMRWETKLSTSDAMIQFSTYLQENEWILDGQIALNGTSVTFHRGTNEFIRISTNPPVYETRINNNSQTIIYGAIEYILPMRDEC